MGRDCKGLKNICYMAVCKTYDFAWQKDTFCRLKGNVLQGKRYGFAGRRGVCWFAWSSWGGAIVVLMEVNKCDVLGGGAIMK